VKKCRFAISTEPASRNLSFRTLISDVRSVAIHFGSPGKSGRSISSRVPGGTFPEASVSTLSRQTPKFPPTPSIHSTSRVSIRIIYIKYCILTVITFLATILHGSNAKLARTRCPLSISLLLFHPLFSAKSLFSQRLCVIFFLFPWRLQAVAHERSADVSILFGRYPSATRECVWRTSRQLIASSTSASSLSSFVFFTDHGPRNTCHVSTIH
jgi:hypothetical protein